MIGSALSSSMYNSSASVALCFVPALADDRPFSASDETVALRDLPFI